MMETAMTRRDLLSRLASAAVLPIAAVPSGRGPASSGSQIEHPLHYASLAEVARLIVAREIK